jgi:hypothetical protein
MPDRPPSPISPDPQTLSDGELLALRRALDLEALQRNLRRIPEPHNNLFARRHEDADRLLGAIREREADLRQALDAASGEWTYCDPIYRFYHHSFKVYRLQGQTLEIRDTLQALLPELPLNALLTRIIEAGTGHVFEQAHNRDWLAHTLPITTAFFHTRFFLEMAVRCARFERVEHLLASDLAALLYLFDLR